MSEAKALDDVDKDRDDKDEGDQDDGDQDDVDKYADDGLLEEIPHG